MGLHQNVTMAHLLGCKTDFLNIKPYFTLNEQKIYVIFDPCHMLKLIRNTFGEKKN